MSPSEDAYKNRDLLLGEIHESTKNTERTLDSINTWCKDHDKKDDQRFLLGALAIIIIAFATGVLPEVLKSIHF